MRYLVVKLHEKSDKPWSEQEKCGSGPDSQTFLYYANVQNVIRFGLARSQFTPGQYNIYLWPEGQSRTPKNPIATAYKRV